jgi:dolichol-phosphate mannosyltransferase
VASANSAGSGLRHRRVTPDCSIGAPPTARAIVAGMSGARSSGGESADARVAAVVPAYRVADRVVAVVSAIPPVVSVVYVVDDACPDGSGARVREVVSDPRVHVIEHAANLGVGGATVTGFRQALADGADIVVKIDGDGQMSPGDIPLLLEPLLAGEADFAKGNRFWDLESLASMPWVRLAGNAALSFLTKFSTGYWNVFDPTNGFIALRREALARVPLDKLSRRYFFESDLLFRLYIARAVVRDVSMEARYGGETSSMTVARVIPEFLVKHVRNLVKRIFYSYFLRDFSIASVELLLGGLLLLGGAAFGAFAWARGSAHAEPATAGTVMLAGLPVILGVQLLVGFLQFDFQNVPRRPLSARR